MIKRTALFLLLLAAVTVAVSSCRKPPPPPPPLPPAPTADTIFNDIKGTLDPLETVLSDPKKVLSPAEGDGVLNKIRENKANPIKAKGPETQTQEARDNAAEALRRFTASIEDITNRARKQERWMVVKYACQAFKVMEPTDAKFDKLTDLAQLHLDRPKVRVRGFFDDLEKNEVYVFVEVSTPKTGKLESQKVRLGQEFCGLRLDSIVGKRKGIRLEYLAIPGEMFEVMAP